MTVAMRLMINCVYLISDCLLVIDSMYQSRIVSAYAPSTASNFRNQMNQFLNFYNQHDLPVFPPVPMNVARYLTVCASKNMVYGTIQNKLSAVAKFYRLCECNLDVSHPCLDLLMKACKRDLSATSKPKAPIEPGHILLIRTFCDQSDLTNRLFFVALVTQFFTCFRKSNLLPPSLNTFSPFKHLTRGDIKLCGSNIVFTLPWSKTLQSRDNIMTVSLAAAPPGSILDPVDIIVGFLRDFPLPKPTMPAFSLFDGHRLVVLTQQVYINLLKHHLAVLGLPPDAYSSHSVRRGGTTLLWEAGAKPNLIKLHGGWKSDCYARYIDPNFSQRLQPSQLMVSHINKLFGAP